jgi:hypothetical protein
MSVVHKYAKIYLCAWKCEETYNILKSIWNTLASRVSLVLIFLSWKLFPFVLSKRDIIQVITPAAPAGNHAVIHP